MNDTAIKNYAVWARRELLSEVEKRCAWWSVSEDAQTDVDNIDGRVLSVQERKQRGDLLRMVRVDGYNQFVEKAAYIWFNRLLAIRFMEVNDRLPNHVRILSSVNGSFEPQCLREALDLPLSTLNKDKAARLIQAGDDESLFQLVFLAQCAELAECMPAVFEPVGSAMELLLPTGLLRADGVIGKLVTDIPEDDWREGVEIVGWMYQYYVSERKDEVFASFKKGKKAEREAIAPATQLFTPHWIVRYLTENSLGRLWMLNHPNSNLLEKMPYFIKPDDEDEADFKHVSSPEEITCVDPACGSGHIVVYAFDLLAAMYEEAGYSNRDAARLIIEKNLTGFEIDSRAGAMASFALTMKACELDSRFLRRGVVPKIVVLERFEFQPDELASCPNVAVKKSLLDAIAHLDECGSLLQPSADDLAAIERDLASLANGSSLFAGMAAEKLERLQAALQPLAMHYDVVVANPPYMGSSSLGSWMSAWVKKQYPDEKSDLCTSFIERGFSLSANNGTNAMVTMQSWMFLGSFEKMREKLLKKHALLSMAHLGTRAFGSIAGEVVSTTATVFSNAPSSSNGTFVRLVDMGGEDEKREGYLEALANHECGWYYRRSANAFESLPGGQIAYWLGDGASRAFLKGVPLGQLAYPRTGFTTGDNEVFLRLWGEVAVHKIGRKWFYLNKGGDFRKWYGNNEYVVDWENNGIRMKNAAGSTIRNPDYYFKRGATWGKITSSHLSSRMMPENSLFDAVGLACFPSSNMSIELILALLNSNAIDFISQALNPTLSFSAGVISDLPVMSLQESCDVIERYVSENIYMSKTDWDMNETSWDFKRHPLV